MSACIIPVTPNFQDPPSVPASPPYLFNFEPQNFGGVVTVPVPAGKTFSANVSDEDLSAELHVRWVVDYPPFVDGVTYFPGQTTTISRSANGQTINQVITQAIDCSWITQPLTSTHQLELIVADRELLESSTFGLMADNKLDSTDPKNPGHVVRAFWNISISCPATTTSSSSSP